MAPAELLARARTGEREAFTELVERHHAELVWIAYAITGDLDAARDSAQLAWIKAWQRLPSVREPERLRAWLIAIAANEARQHLRAHRRRSVREIAPLRQDEMPGQSATTSAWRPDLHRGQRFRWLALRGGPASLLTGQVVTRYIV
jgi:RNA polymerase sigma-70 factor, ECF subfamily